MSESPKRRFLRVEDFDKRQNPKRPKRPTWIKMFVRDIDDPQYLSLSLTNRGFLGDFMRLAADMEGRVPDDVRFIARRLDAPPRVVGKALNTCITHRLITVFDEDAFTRQNKDIDEESATPANPPSSSHSYSESSGSSTKLESTTVPQTDNEIPDICPACDGEGCHWCEPSLAEHARRNL